MPVDKGSHLQDRESVVYENQKTYQALVGSLTYAAMSTCPDIGYVTQFLSQANKHPSQWDWNTVKRVLRYLKGTKELGIVFRRDPGMGQAEHDPASPWGYCDANYVEDPRDQKSTVVTLSCLPVAPYRGNQRNKHPFHFQPRRQNITP